MRSEGLMVGTASVAKAPPQRGCALMVKGTPHKREREDPPGGQEQTAKCPLHLVLRPAEAYQRAVRLRQPKGRKEARRGEQ